MKTVKEEALLSTGQAAKLCSVTSDTLVKWIKAGILQARRTAGGHYRVRRQDVEELLERGGAKRLRPTTPVPERVRHFRYCWEYNGNGKLLKGCQECAVYLLRARRCYEVARLATDVGHKKLFCQKSCAECDYYQAVQRQGKSVLVVTDNQDLAASLLAGAEGLGVRLEVTDCEYKCSAVVEVLRPDYVVIDCSLGPEVSRDICHHVLQDPRIPYVRVIMAGEQAEFPEGCDKQVFARLEKPFNVKDIMDCIHGSPVAGAYEPRVGKTLVGETLGCSRPE